MVPGFLKAVNQIIILSSSEVGQSVLDGLEAVLKLKSIFLDSYSNLISATSLLVFKSTNNVINPSVNIRLKRYTCVETFVLGCAYFPCVCSPVVFFSKSRYLRLTKKSYFSLFHGLNYLEEISKWSTINGPEEFTDDMGYVVNFIQLFYESLTMH